MPRFVFGVDGAEPLPTNAAMASGGRIAGLACCGQRLTDPFEVRGLCLIVLLEHGYLLLSGILSPCDKEVVTKNRRASRVPGAIKPGSHRMAFLRRWNHFFNCQNFADCRPALRTTLKLEIMDETDEAP
jgi:hypothetical protein